MPRKHVIVILVVVLICCVCFVNVDKYAGSQQLVRRIVLEKALEPMQERQLFDGMLNGMMSSLDRFSCYIPPEEFQDFNAALTQEFGGVGLAFGIDESTNRPTVYFVTPNAPAALAGIKSGDILVSVDGTSLEGKNTSEISTMLRGTVDTSVMLGVERPSEKKTLSFSITRRKIQTETVEGDVRRPDGTWNFILPEMPMEDTQTESAGSVGTPQNGAEKASAEQVAKGNTPARKATAGTPSANAAANAAANEAGSEAKTTGNQTAVAGTQAAVTGNQAAAAESQAMTGSQAATGSQAVAAEVQTTADQAVADQSPAPATARPRKIAYVRITSFGERTASEMKRCLIDLQSQNITGLVVDLRDNPGGLLTTAVEICDMFLNKGVIVSIRGRDRELINAYEATQGIIWNPEIPITILLNENSASASEIMSACLQDYSQQGVLKVVCVGARSYGKGTVQQLIDLGPLPGDRDLDGKEDSSTASLWKKIWEKPKRGALKLTMASYWRPSEKNIHRFADATEDDVWGVMPNEGLAVAFPDPSKSKKEEKAEVAALSQMRTQRWNGQLKAEDVPQIFALDPQLKKAVSWLSEQ